MAAVIIRNVPDATLRALKKRAASHRRSTEAEIREILRAAVHPPDRIRVGSELAAFGRQFHGLDLQVDRDPRPAEPAIFE
jgi:plasmid stability protein